MSGPYTSAFYAENVVSSTQSCAAVVPVLMEWLAPRSVVDVGCGVGGWLAEFVEQGVADVLGVDGAHVDRAWLKIPGDTFMSHDLGQPLRMDRTFDVVLSLEVAEHLSPARAAGFVSDLCALGPVVVFSAAIPGQSGQGHVNEQWPEYWIDHFDHAGYRVVDCLRPRLWNMAGVSYWYAQNMLLFVDRARLPDVPGLAAVAAASPGPPYARVHPGAWAGAVDLHRRDWWQLICAVPRALARGIRVRLSK